MSPSGITEDGADGADEGKGASITPTSSKSSDITVNMGKTHFIFKFIIMGDLVHFNLFLKLKNKNHVNVDEKLF